MFGVAQPQLARQVEAPALDGRVVLRQCPSPEGPSETCYLEISLPILHIPPSNSTFAYQESARVGIKCSGDSDRLAASGAVVRLCATQNAQPAHTEQQQSALHIHARPLARHALARPARPGRALKA